MEGLYVFGLWIKVGRKGEVAFGAVYGKRKDRKTLLFKNGFGSGHMVGAGHQEDVPDAPVPEDVGGVDRIFVGVTGLVFSQDAAAIAQGCAQARWISASLTVSSPAKMAPEPPLKSKTPP
jgi:hypothetical protein